MRFGTSAEIWTATRVSDAAPRRAGCGCQRDRVRARARAGVALQRAQAAVAPVARRAQGRWRGTRRLSGGAHRYQEQDGPRHHIESGGGGAFLHPTHNLPPRADLPGPNGPTAYRQAATYPSAAFSKGLRKRIWLMPAYNIPLAAVFGTVQVLLAFMLGLHLEDCYVSLGVGDLLRAMWDSPTAFLLSLLVLASLVGMVRFAHDASGIGRILLGLAHVVAGGERLRRIDRVVVPLGGIRARGRTLPAHLPGPHLATRRHLRDDGNGRISLGERLPRPAQHRGLRPASPSGPKALSAAAHRRRRLTHDLPRGDRARRPQVGCCAPTRPPMPPGSPPKARRSRRI
ncbi:MAG: hypothetical protein LC749_04095 [Actinobacteria bacterium]|nr:hypothetical protein [Actinomycetota bacterium]